MAVNVVDDHLAHYGVPGMKWGKRKNAQRLVRNASIDGARSRQAMRSAEVKTLTSQRISERSEKGKAHLDRKIADKKFEIDNNEDVALAKQKKASEKVMTGVKVAALLGMTVMGMGVAASIINTEIGKREEEEWPFPRTLKEHSIVERERAGEKVSIQEKAEVIMDRKNTERFNK